MLDISKIWFFVQLINFLVLLIALNYILFRPLLRLLNERGQKINGSLERAKTLDMEKDKLLNQIQAKLAETRNKAEAIFQELSKAGIAEQKKAIESAQKEGVAITQKAKEHLEMETKKAKESLMKDIETFSKKIIEKMIGA